MTKATRRLAIVSAMALPLLALFAVSIPEEQSAEAHAGHPQKKLFAGRWYTSAVDLTTSPPWFGVPDFNEPCDGGYDNASCVSKWQGPAYASLADWNNQLSTARFNVQSFRNHSWDNNIYIMDTLSGAPPGLLGLAVYWTAGGQQCLPDPSAGSGYCAVYRYSDAYIIDDNHTGSYSTPQSRQATITHELGHVLTLRHESVNSDESVRYECGQDNTGQTPVSVMSYDCVNPTNVGGSGIYTVQPWDVCGVNHAYPDPVYEWEGCVCNPPPTGSALPPIPPSEYYPVTPSRVLDTRPAPFGPINAPAGKLGYGCVLTVQVTDIGGVPIVSAGVKAVVLNVTATQPSQASHLTIYPSGTTLPNAANLNFAAGQTVPNLVTVAVGPDDGSVRIYNNSGQTHVIFDVVGWYGTPGSGSPYTPVTPKRILDTRGTPYGPIGRDENGALIPASQLGHGGVMSVDVTNTYASDVPDTQTTAVAVNVTVTQPSAPSHLTIYPSNEGVPNAANLNFVAGQTVPNLVIVKVGPASGGSVRVRNNSGSVHVIFDIVGWYGGATGDLFTPLPPARIMDTRPPPFGPIGWPGKLGHGGTANVDVTGVGGVPPAGVTGVVVNTTVTQPTAPSHLTVYPADVGQPNAANLNFVGGQTVPNLVMVRVPTLAPQEGRVNVYNNSGQTHVIFDVAGYFAPPP